MSKNTWKTEKGEVLKISDMEISHIENCIAMLERDMPDHEDEQWITADFPESMRYRESSICIYGAKTYREKIQEFKDELKQRSQTTASEWLINH